MTNWRSKAILLIAATSVLLFGAMPLAQAATGDYYTLSVSDQGGAFRTVWQGTNLADMYYSSTLIPMASGSHNCEYKISGKDIYGNTTYTLSNYLSWKWASGRCTILSRHYHQSSPGSGWEFMDLHGNSSGYGTGYCYGKYKAHFHWSGTWAGIPVSANAYPGLSVRGNSGGSHSSSSY